MTREYCLDFKCNRSKIPCLHESSWETWRQVSANRSSSGTARRPYPLTIGAQRIGWPWLSHPLRKQGINCSQIATGTNYTFSLKCFRCSHVSLLPCHSKINLVLFHDMVQRSFKTMKRFKTTSTERWHVSGLEYEVDIGSSLTVYFCWQYLHLNSITKNHG